MGLMIEVTFNRLVMCSNDRYACNITHCGKRSTVEMTTNLEIAVWVNKRLKKKLMSFRERGEASGG
jgi:hypothetical protein